MRTETRRGPAPQGGSGGRPPPDPPDPPVEDCRDFVVANPSVPVSEFISARFPVLLFEGELAPASIDEHIRPPPCQLKHVSKVDSLACRQCGLQLQYKGITVWAGLASRQRRREASAFHPLTPFSRAQGRLTLLTEEVVS